MKTSISIATFLLAGSGVAGVAAANLPSPFQGSDTLFDITQAAISTITTIGPASAYIGGGSGNGQSAMFANSQGEAPMSRMINNGASICTYDAGGNGQTNAAGIVIALDAVDVLASAVTGGATSLADGGVACNADGGGLIHNGGNFTNYKQVLALLYGGEKNGSNVVDCNTPNRVALVSNWANLYQDGCANPCNDGTHGGAMWHAWRRDDASGTSDVFATILGLAPSTSASSNGGFGASPYCNSMNWDVTTANANCGLHAGLQFTGPGGVPQGQCTTNGIMADGTFCTTPTATGPCFFAPCWAGYNSETCPASGTCFDGSTCTPGTSTCIGGVCSGGTSSLIGSKCATPDSVSLCSPTNTTVCAVECGYVSATPNVPNGVPDTCGNIDTIRGTTGPATTHRRPPLGTWGDNPDPNGGAGAPTAGTHTRSADAFPTSMQDNDPIRHTCYGASTNNSARPGEEVCNIDGTLGVVVPIPATDFLLKATVPLAGLKQFPTNPPTNTGKLALPPGVHNCAIRAGQPRGGSRNLGQCPNGDQQTASKCQVPTDDTNGTSQTVATKAQPAPKNRPIAWDGRAFNLHMHDGTNASGAIGYVIQTIPTTPGNAGLFCGDGSACPAPGTAGTPCPDGSVCLNRISLDFTGAFNRIHQTQTFPQNIGACQLKDATDQIGCLVHADRCTMGYAGDGSRSWVGRSPIGICSVTPPNLPCVLGQPCGNAGTGICNPIASSDNAALLVNNVGPSTATVQLLGQLGEYPLSRKLYLSSLAGFAVAPSDSELTLAKFESQGAGSPMAGLVTSNGFFPLGASSPMGTDTPFCEDFNQHTICNTAGNDNACNRMPGNPGIDGGVMLLADGGTSPISDAAADVVLPGDPSADPTQATTSTVCGNGIVESYEECDPATPFTCADGTACTVGGAACADASACIQTRTWRCSVPGATSCTSTCRC